VAKFSAQKPSENNETTHNIIYHNETLSFWTPI